MRVALYLRVSTKEQTTDLQRTDLLEFCKTKGWSDITIYEDTGVSGASTDRAGLNRLMVDAHAGQVDVMICWKIDRLFRSLRHMLNIVAELTELKTKFIALKDDIDLTTESGELMFQIRGVFAQYERNIIRKRVKAGMAAAKKKGIHLGRPKRRDDFRIKELKEQGLTIKKIAECLNTSIRTVQRSLAA